MGGKPDFLGNWCLQRQPGKALRLQKQWNRKMDYGYIWGRKVSKESFGHKNW